MTFSKLKIVAALTALAMSTAATSVVAQQLTTYAKISDTRPGNITVTPDNRVIITPCGWSK